MGESTGEWKQVCSMKKTRIRCAREKRKTRGRGNRRLRVHGELTALQCARHKQNKQTHKNGVQTRVLTNFQCWFNIQGILPLCLGWFTRCLDEIICVIDKSCSYRPTTEIDKWIYNYCPHALRPFAFNFRKQLEPIIMILCKG